MGLILWAVGVGLTQGFTHCAGMCGPFVLAFSASVADRPEGSTRAGLRQASRLYTAHTVGRLAMFVLMGALFGLIGSFVNAAARATRVEAVAGIVGGLLMMAWAVDQWRTGHAWAGLEQHSLIRWGPVRRWFQAAMSRRTTGGALTAGLLLGLHPCGLLFAMLVAAAATASAWRGALELLAFGVGTIPALTGVAIAGWYGRRRLNAPWVSRLSAVLVAATGVLFALRGLAINGWIPEVNPWLF
jgi:sulfite exporter TauE/SafE